MPVARDTRAAREGATEGVLRGGRVSAHDLEGCSSVTLRLNARDGELGFLAHDEHGRFDGDETGRAGVQVTAADGALLGVELAARRRVRGLFLGASEAARTSAGHHAR